MKGINIYKFLGSPLFDLTFEAASTPNLFETSIDILCSIVYQTRNLKLHQQAAEKVCSMFAQTNL